MSAHLPPACVEFYWLATVRTDDGRQITDDGTVPADTRHHTRQSTTRAVLDCLKGRYGGLTVIFLYLEPNTLASTTPLESPTDDPWLPPQSTRRSAT